MKKEFFCDMVWCKYHNEANLSNCGKGSYDGYSKTNCPYKELFKELNENQNEKECIGFAEYILERIIKIIHTNKYRYTSWNYGYDINRDYTTDEIYKHYREHKNGN